MTTDPNVQIERTKLLASWMNSVGTAAAAAGGIAPAVAAFYGVSGAAPFGRLLVGMVLWIGVGFGLHLVARVILRGLKP
jgi:hypothetical protein